MSQAEMCPDQAGPGALRWQWAVLVLVMIAAFLPTIDAPYQADDYRLFAKPLPSDYRALLQTNLYYMRPLPALTMRGEYLIWGSQTIGPHVTNLLMHVLTTLLVGALARRLTGDRSVAFCSAALFGLHPIHAGAVSWLSARFDLCCALLGLSAVLKFDDFLVSQSRRALALSLLAFAGALFSKEAAVCFLPALLLWAWARSGPGRALPWRPLGVFGLVLLLYGGLRAGVVEDDASLAKVNLASIEWVWGAIFTPVRLLALPLDEAQWGRWAGPLGVALVCLLGATLALCVASNLREGRGRPSHCLLFGLGFLLIALAPLAPVVHRLTGEVAAPTRLLYTPSVGFCLLVGLLVGRRGLAVRSALLLGWMLLYGAGLFGNNLAWRRAGELAGVVPQQIQELVSRHNDPSIIKVFVEDVPRFHNGAYVYLGSDLARALRPLLDPKISVVWTNSKPTSKQSVDLRKPKRYDLWLGFRWDDNLEQVIDVTDRLRLATAAFSELEPAAQVWRGDGLHAWTSGDDHIVDEKGLTSRTPGGALKLRSPALPINTAELEVHVSVRAQGRSASPPRLNLRWGRDSEKSTLPQQSYRLKRGMNKLSGLLAPAAGRIEDLEGSELRALISIPEPGYEVHVKSIRFLTLSSNSGKD